MIVENDCLILQIFQMSDRETREEVPMNVMIHQQAEHEAQRVQANRVSPWTVVGLTASSSFSKPSRMYAPSHTPHGMNRLKRAM